MATKQEGDVENFILSVKWKDKKKPPKLMNVYNFNVNESGGLTYFLGNEKEVREVNFHAADTVRAVRGTKIQHPEPSVIMPAHKKLVVM